MTKRHNQEASKPRRESRATYNKRRAMVAAGLLATAVAGKFAYDKVDELKANQGQPVCEVPVHSGDTISGIKSEIRRAGDDVRGEHVEVWTHGSNSHQRTAETDPRTFFVNGQMGMQPGDTLRIEHVDPNVCLEVGGFPTDPETGSHK